MVRGQPGDLPQHLYCLTFGIKVWPYAAAALPWLSVSKRLYTIFMKYTALLFGILFTHLIAAQDSLAVTQQLDSVFLATKVKLDRRNSGQVSVQITQKELRLFNGFSLASVLNRVSGFEFNGSTGHPGQNIGMYVRGGGNRQVLVIIDGAVVSDPSQIATDFDLRLLPLSQIESIEIIKGAASVLYGSGAATAVISIITKKATKAGWTTELSHQLGTNRTADKTPFEGLMVARQMAVSGVEGDWQIRLDATQSRHSGLSAIIPKSDTPLVEQDVVIQRTIKTALRYRPKPNISMGQFVSYDVFDHDFDGFDYQDAPHKGKTQQLRSGGDFKWDYKKGTYAFNDQWNKTIRTVRFYQDTRYTGIGYNFDQYLSHHFGKKLSGVIGTQGGFASMSVEESNIGGEWATSLATNTANYYFIDPYLNAHWQSDKGMALQAGIRHHWHQLYGPQWVYQINPSYRFNYNNGQAKVFYTKSTAFIAPALYQLYDPIYGNSALLPEHDHTQELGLEVTQDKGFRWSAVYFKRNEKQRVDFLLLDPETYQYAYGNADGDRSVSGLESEFDLQLNEAFKMSAGYTFIAEENLLRIPRHKLSADLDITINPSEQLRFQWLYSSKRLDRYYDTVSFSARDVFLPSYHWIDLLYQVVLTPQVRATITLSNILDGAAAPLYGYTPQGRNLKIDVAWRF